MIDKDKKLINEKQIEDIVKNALGILTFDDDPTIKKHILERRINKIAEIVTRLDVLTEKTTMFPTPLETFYIPVNSTNTEPFDIRITFITDENTVGAEVIPAKTYSFGLVLMHNFCNDLKLKPVCNFITSDIRKILKKINVNVIRNDRTYIEVSLGEDITNLRVLKLYISINNCLGDVNIITKKPINTNTSKNTEVLLAPIIGFDDIPERNKLLRSDTVKKYELIEEDAYSKLERDGLLKNDTVYNIVEGGGINNE